MHVKNPCISGTSFGPAELTSFASHPAASAESEFLVVCYSDPNNNEGKKLLRGGLLADPFVIARAAVAGATVVTMETFKPKDPGGYWSVVFCERDRPSDTNFCNGVMNF